MPGLPAKPLFPSIGTLALKHMNLVQQIFPTEPVHSVDLIRPRGLFGQWLEIVAEGTSVVGVDPRSPTKALDFQGRRVA